MKPYGFDLSKFTRWYNFHYKCKDTDLYKKARKYLRKAVRRKYKQDLKNRKQDD